MHKAVFACGSMVLSVFCGSFFAQQGEKRPTKDENFLVSEKPIYIVSLSIGSGMLLLVSHLLVNAGRLCGGRQGAPAPCTAARGLRPFEPDSMLAYAERLVLMPPLFSAKRAGDQRSA